jgi:quercetin dioxygenase-like cupin family protein
LQPINKENVMKGLARSFAVALGIVALAPATSPADIDRNAVDFVAAKDIKFVRNEAGTNEQAILFGDPTKPGPYVIQLRWLPGNMSRPHFHPNDRFFVVLEGTWWLGTGTKYDPDSTVPVGPGTYVYHKAGQVHYDGAKGEPALIQVWGMGPATSTPAEVR